MSELKERVRSVLFEATISAGKVFDVVFDNLHPIEYCCRLIGFGDQYERAIWALRC